MSSEPTKPDVPPVRETMNTSPSAKLPSAASVWITPAAILGSAGLVVSFLNYEGSVLAGRFGGVEARMQAVESRVQTIDQRIQGVDDKVDRRAEAVEKRIEAVTQLLDTLVGLQGDAKSQTAKIETELSYVRGRLDRIADKLQVASAQPTPFALPSLSKPALSKNYDLPAPPDLTGSLVDDDQRNYLRAYVSRQPVDATPGQLGASAAKAIVPGEVIPRSVRFRDLPPQVGTAAMAYKYFKVHDAVVLVDPSTRRVVEVID